MPESSPTPGSFAWFECGSRDAATAKRFYTRLFDWTAEDRPMTGGMEGHYTIFRRNGADVAGLYQLAGPMADLPPHWATYVTVKSADEAVRRVAELGGKVGCPPMDVPGVGRMAFIQDPTGAALAVFEPGAHRGVALQGPTPGSFCWAELATNDLPAAGEFYSALFDWGLKKSEGEVHYTEFELAGEAIGGMMPLERSHGDAPPHWLPYVTVIDCDATVEMVTVLGGKIAEPATDIPGVGCFAVVLDPGGAGLAVIQFPEGAA